ncbi:MAG: Methionyl-tRNA formyltransferase [Parcubacteria group bacterium GW2011_GWF1_40_6]|nr:MAG: Methionyl-tRNA formyltransferase [Parcubacteria group bacterium GW2011_GWF1_40_6]
MKKINFIFWGTPEVASETLDILKKNGYVPSLIVTASDKPQGRKMLIAPPPVKVWAKKNNIPCIQPEKLTPSAFSTSPLIRGRLDGGIELSIVVAYGKIIPEEILNIPKLGSINIHYSLLPKYRGASPVESAILNGEVETGVTIQKMEYKMDSGPILAMERVSIFPDEKASDLRGRLIKIGGNLLVKILPDLIEGKIKEIPQNETEATFCKKIKKEDGLVDLGAELPNVLYNKFRAYATWPRTFFFQNNKRIIITDATLENNQFVIKKVLPEGKKEIDYKNFNLRYGVD